MSESDIGGQTREWHDERRAVLGASDFAIIGGGNTYQSELYLWALKTGRMLPWEGNEATDRGQRLEAGVMSRWLVANDAELCDSPGFLLGGEGWYGGHPDGFATLDNGKTVCIEVKTTTDTALDAVQKYWMQCQTYLGLARENGWPDMTDCHLYVATLDAFSPDHLDLASYETFVVKHDESVWQDMLLLRRAWWYEHVVNDVPPFPVPKDMDLLTKIWPTDNGTSIPLDDLACSALEEISDLRNQIKWQQTILKWCLREAQTGTIFGEPEVQWKNSKTMRVLKIFKQ